MAERLTEPRPMSDTEYSATQQGLMTLCGIARMYDFHGFLARIGTAHAVGPIVDPTRYRDAMKNLQAIEDLARAAAAFKAAIEKAAPAVTT